MNKTFALKRCSLERRNFFVFVQIIFRRVTDIMANEQVRRRQEKQTKLHDQQVEIYPKVTKKITNFQK